MSFESRESRRGRLLTLDGASELIDKTDRGSKICSVILNQHIHRRDIIGSLVEAGADKDFKDENRDGNTPLHCSIIANDIPIIKYLLELKVNTSIENRESLTPMELARKIGNEETIKVLRPHCFLGKSIESKYIQEASGRASAFKVIADNVISAAFKILKIKNIKTFEDAKNIMATKDFYEKFALSSNWFITSFIIRNDAEFLKADSLEFPEEVLQFFQKPCVIQFKHQSHIKIFFKDSNMSSFENIELNRMSEEAFSAVVAQNNFGNLLKFLYDKGFSDDLLAARIDANQTFNEKSLIDHAIRYTNNTLALRFLMLYNWDFNSYDEGLERIFEKAVAWGSAKTVRTLLNLPFAVSKGKIFLSEEQKSVPELRNVDGKNALELACLKGSEDVLECLLQFNLEDSNEKGEGHKNTKLSKIAWDTGRYMHLAKLILAEKCFPPVTKKAMMKVPLLASDIKNRDKFHTFISKGALESVKKIVESSSWRYAFNWKNESALMAALNTQAEETFPIYAFLLSKGFMIGSHEVKKHTESLKNIKESSMKRKFEESCKIFNVGDENSHINHLHANSLDQTLPSKFSDKRKSFFVKLNKIPELRLVMMVLKHSPISIMFDFSSDNIKNIYPSDNPSLESCHGAHNFKSREIFIAGKRPDNEILGTLAHELTHMAMQVCFGNECKPYEKNSEKENDFQKIVAQYGTSLRSRAIQMPIIIEAVFRYDESERPCELIVRINHLLAQSDDGRSICENQCKSLLEFYKKNVATRLGAFIENPSRALRRLKIQDLNASYGYLDEVLKNKIKFRNVTPLEDFVDKQQIQIITSSYTLLTVLDLFYSLGSKPLKVGRKNKTRSFVEITGSYLFMNDSIIKKNKEIVVEKCNAGTSIVVEVLNSPTKEWWSEIFKTLLESAHLIIVTKPENQTLFKKLCKRTTSATGNIFRNYTQMEKCYEWMDFSNETQKKFLNKKVNYQGINSSLKEILPVNVEKRNSLLNLLPFEALMQEKELHIDTDSLVNFEYSECSFIHRTFIEPKFSTKDVKKIYQHGENEKIIIIADTAGMGKSILLTYFSRTFKKHCPKNWVVRLGLMVEVLTALASGSCSEDSNDCAVLLNLLNLKNEYEIEIFKHNFAEGNVILFLDGVDEVELEPTETLSAIKKIARSKYRQLWLATRKGLQSQLETAFNKKCLTLQTFKKPNQIEFLTDFWTKYVIGDEQKPKLKQFAIELIECLSKALGKEEAKLIGIPLQTRMVAEIFVDQVVKWCQSENPQSLDKSFKNIDLNWLYKRFLSNKICLWIDRNRDSITNEPADVMKYGWKLHQKLAIKSHFRESQVALLFPNSQNLKQDIKRVANDSIQKIGLLHFQGPNPKFAHRTYAEYFIADYIVDELLEFSKWNDAEANFFFKTFISKKCDMVRKFINSILKHHKTIGKDPTMVNFAAKIKYCFKIDTNRDILYFAIKENLTVFLSTILKSLKQVDRSAINSFQFHIKEKSIFYHAVVNGSLETFEALIETFKSRKGLNKVLLEKDSENECLIHKAIGKYTFVDFEKLLQIVLKLMTAREKLTYFRDEENRTSILKRVSECYNREEYEIINNLVCALSKARRAPKRKVQ